MIKKKKNPKFEFTIVRLTYFTIQRVVYVIKQSVSPNCLLMRVCLLFSGYYIFGDSTVVPKNPLTLIFVDYFWQRKKLRFQFLFLEKKKTQISVFIFRKGNDTELTAIQKGFYLLRFELKIENITKTD